MLRSITRFHLVLCMALSPISTVLAIDTSTGLPNIKDLKRPSENLFTAGQPQENEFSAIAKTGIRHIINLRPPTETPAMNEAAIVTRNNMLYYNIPVNGKGDLTRENVDLLDQVLRNIGNEKALLHCSSSNRVGALMALRAAWLNGASLDEALAEGDRHGLTKLRPAVINILSAE